MVIIFIIFTDIVIIMFIMFAETDGDDIYITDK